MCAADFFFIHVYPHSNTYIGNQLFAMWVYSARVLWIFTFLISPLLVEFKIPSREDSAQLQGAHKVHTKIENKKYR